MRATLHLLGGAHLGEREHGLPLPADRRGCLLAYLACDGGWVDRDRLALLFWPDADERAAKRNLRQLLLRVRRLALAEGLEAAPSAVRWSVDCDVMAFRRALAAGERERAVRLYAGALLEGFVVHDVGGFDAWLELERQRLHEGYHEAVTRAADAAASAGRVGDAIDMLRRLLATEPLAEDVLQAYLRVLMLDGRRGQAVAAYGRFARLLDDELGLEPLAATRALAEAARRGEAIAVAGSRRQVAAPFGGRNGPQLVAREAEAAALRAAGTPVVLVAGEPGVGKTRLLRETWPEAARTGALEGLDGVPYQPFAAWARRSPDLVAGLGPYREDLARLVPDVAPDLTPVAMESEIGKARLAEALARMVDASGGTLVVDDLQWADGATLETVAYLAARGNRVVGAFRADEVGPPLRRAIEALRARGAVTVLTLAPLDEEGIRALLADLMRRSAGPPVFGRWLWQRSGGNPLFALETLRTLFEAGVLREGDHGWETDIDDLTLDYGEIEVPPAVAGVIRRRVERLSEAAQRALEAASLLQGPLAARLLARVTGLSPFAVADGLDEATGAGFLEGGEFRHDLLRQTLASGLAPARRRLIHAVAAEALEGVVDDGVVAEHWLGAEEPTRARAAWIREAAALRGRGLPSLAGEVLERALARCEHERDRGFLRVALADAWREAGRVQEAMALADGVLASAPENAELRLAAVVAKVSLLLVAGRLQEAERWLTDTAALPALVGDPELRLEHLILRARVAKQLLRSEEALALLEPEAERLRQRPPGLRLCQLLTGVGVLYDDLGRQAEGMAHLREAHDLARALGARYLQVDIAINLLFCYADQRRYDDADALARETLALGHYDNTAIFRSNLAAIHFEAGRFREALEHYRPLRDEVDQPFLRAIALARSAEAHAALGDGDPVPELLDVALDTLPATDYPVVLGRVAVAVLRLGTDAQRARLLALAPDLSSARLPPHQRAEFEDAWRHASGVTEA
ncbi:MAG: BTAD domain-containing putative transcriptional regulator [Trueperaceae bacterium]